MEAKGNIRTFDPGVEQGWDALSSSHPNGSIFHSTGWARALCASYGHKPHFLAAMNGNRPGAQLPILEVNTLLKGRRGISLPFSDEGGLLCFDGDDGSKVFERALELGRQRRWKYLEVRGKISCRPDAPAWDTFVGHEIKLTGGDEAIFGRFREFSERVQSRFPGTRLIFVSTTRSPDRVELWDKVDHYNALVRAYVAATPYHTFVDINPALVDANGHPKLELYRTDKLHFHPPAYVAFTAIIKPVLTQVWAEVDVPAAKGP